MKTALLILALITSVSISAQTKEDKAFISKGKKEARAVKHYTNIGIRRARMQKTFHP